MVFIRLISLVLIVLALMLLGADIVSTLEMPGKIVVRSFDHILMLLHADAVPWVQMNLPPWLASASLAVLSSPCWAIFGILGVVLSLITPTRRHRAREEAPTLAIER